MHEKPAILIVDDDPNQRITLSDILKAKGYEPVAVPGGKEALEEIEKKPPAAALIDLKLKNMSGLKLIGKIKQRLPGVECIMITGYASRESAIEAINLGAYSYIEKPYDLDQLLVTLRRAVEKQKAEEEYRRLKEFNQSIVEKISEGIIVEDAAGTVQFVNPAAAALLNHSPKELVGKCLIEIFPPDQRSIINAAIERRARGEDDRYELCLLDEHGQPIYLMVSGSPWHESGQFKGSIANYMNVTASRLAEKALQESEEFSSNLLDNSPNPIIVINPDTSVRYVNPALEKLTGFSSSELVGLKAPYPWWTEETAQKTEASFKIALAKSPETVEEIFQNIEGKNFWVEATITPIRIDGVCKYYLSNWVDITDRKQAQDLLRIQSDLAIYLSATSDLVEAANRVLEAAIQVEGIDSGGLYLVDPLAGELDLAAHKGLSSLFVERSSHYDADSPNARLVMKGKPVYKSYPNVFVSEDEVRQSEKLRSHAVIPIYYDGRVVAALNLASHTHDRIPMNARKALEATSTYIGDVFARVRAEDELRKMNQRLQKAFSELDSAYQTIIQQERLAAVGQLAAGIAHDFNNIMCAIILYSEMLLASPHPSKEDHERLATIFQQAQRAASLTEQILDFSRKSVMESLPMDLASLMKEMKELLDRTIPENIQVSMIFHDEDCVINADENRLQQVIMNLALNARDAMPKGGDLKFELTRIRLKPDDQPPLPDLTPGEWVRVDVSDSGAGISAENLAHIFEPFFTTKPIGEGTGLGLAQVYGIVKQHEGYIDVASEVGRGTTFTIYLPTMALPKTDGSPSEQVEPEKGREEVILVVEDEATIREAICEILGGLNYQILEAENGREALEIVERQGGAIDLILADLVMPQMNGRELHAVLKEKGLDIRMVFMTGYYPGDGTRELMEEGHVMWVQKPIDSARLTKIVRQALGEKRG